MALSLGLNLGLVPVTGALETFNVADGANNVVDGANNVVQDL